MAPTAPQPRWFRLGLAWQRQSQSQRPEEIRQQGDDPAGAQWLARLLSLRLVCRLQRPSSGAHAFVTLACSLRVPALSANGLRLQATGTDAETAFKSIEDGHQCVHRHEPTDQCHDRPGEVDAFGKLASAPNSSRTWARKSSS